MKLNLRILSAAIPTVALAAALTTTGAFAWGGNSDASGNVVDDGSSVTNTETSTHTNVHVDVHVGKITVQTSKIDVNSPNFGVVGSNGLNINNNSNSVNVNTISMATMSSNSSSETDIRGKILGAAATMNIDSGNTKNIDSGNTSLENSGSYSSATGGSFAGNSGCSTNGLSLGGGCE